MSGKKGKLPELCYIPCRVEPGMFRGELLAVAEVLSPADRKETIRAQLLVDERDVVDIAGTPKRNDPANGWLRVRALSRESGLVRFIFPQAASPVGETAYIAENVIR